MKDYWLHISQRFAQIVFTEEASEVVQDTSGRWFSFAITLDTIFLLEKKNLPTHLASLPAVDNPTPLRELLLQLEDAGEVSGGKHCCYFKEVHILKALYPETFNK